MARVRRPGAPELPPPTRGPGSSPLHALLTSRRFRLGAGSERAAANLRAHGGEVASDAAAWIGSTRPPPDAPTIGTGEHAGTLGPFSFGFVNLVGGIAPFEAPLPSLPRRGGLSLLVPRREALPDVAPLALARDLGLAWIISVGDGDPAEALAFLAADPATSSIAVVLGAGANGGTLRAALGAKPAVVLGGDEICRAVARRAEAFVADGLPDFLARAALFDAGIEAGSAVSIVVLGGGLRFVEAEARAAGLEAEIQAIDERVSTELSGALERVRRTDTPVLVVAGGPPVAPERPEGVRLLSADLRHPEHLRALFAQLASPAAARDARAPAPRVDKTLAARVRAEVDATLGDHDAKRLLKAWGVRVTRQAPTNTPTGAVKLARQIGLPVVLAVKGEETLAGTLPDVRRVAALLLPSSGEIPSVMVRERFPDAPRTTAQVVFEHGLGLMLRMGDACALLPLSRGEAQTLAGSTLARRAADQRALADLLMRIGACAAGENAVFDLELYVGSEPAVLQAKGELRR